jgi:large repetitive protein
LKRLGFITAVVALLVAGIPMVGSAASFTDWAPCPAQGPLLVCPAAQVGHPYNIQLLAHDGCDDYLWEIVNGAVPPGLHMSDTGQVTGIPTQASQTMPWMIVHDRTAAQGGPSWCGGDNHSERQFVFTTEPGLDIQDQSVPGGTIGQAYSKQLTVWSVTAINPVQGSPTSATWSIASGSLPAGVTLSSSGLLSGTPTAEGAYTFVVQATGGGGTTDTETETLTVRQPLALTSNVASAKAEVGQPFSGAQSATGGSGTFTWSVSSGALPAGLKLGTDGTVSGSPSLAGRYSFTLTVTDSEQRTKSVNVSLVVKPKLGFKLRALKAATSGVPYRAKITTSGGVAPLTWTMTGKSPRGFKLGKTGLLIGTPTKAGTYRFTVTVSDALGAEAKKTLTLVVR